jgi:type I restriction enzyme S subunit
MVPEGWERRPLEKLAQVRSGVAKGKSGLKDPITVPYLRVANVQDGRVVLNEVKDIEIERRQLERYSLQYGDVLMNEGGDYDKLGRGDVWREQIKPCLHQNHVFAVRPDTEELDPFFLAALAASNYGKTYFLSCAKRSTNLASINSTQIKEFPVLLPPLPEQKKIAQILSTWDQAITATERLLENSQQRKKGLMQQLLTGKKRLPGFEGEWGKVKLASVAEMSSGQNAKIIR